MRGQVHLSHLRSEVDDEVTSRGDPLDMRQSRVLAGGGRHPSRWVVPVSDDAGRPALQPCLKAWRRGSAS